MIADLTPYPAMKDSGVEWLGTVPEHWEVTRGKVLFRCIDARSATGEEDLLTVSSDRGIVSRESAAVTMFKAASYVGHKLCWPGDLVINSLWAWSRGLGVSRYHGIVSTAYGVYRLRRPLEVSAAYIDKLVRSTPFNWELRVRSKGIWISRLQLTDDAFLGAPFPIPPVDEQTAIVRFLDHADRCIRRYIRAKERLIELLEEERQATIHEAVTGQIDVRTGQPYPAYKDSGVEWLRQVPAHWEVCTLGRIAESFRTGPFGSMLHQSDYVEDGTPVINPIHMNNGAIIEDPSCSVPKTVAERLSSYRLCLHDLVFSRRGELGRCAMVRSREVGWLCGTGSIRVRIERKRIVPKFLIQTLQVRWVGEYLSLSSVGATMDNLNTSILKGVPLLVPPVQQQKDIVEHIGQRTMTIDYGIRKSEEEICLIREFRTRLVADVVTGKLDVREAAAVISDDSAALRDTMETIELENATKIQEEVAL